MLDFRDDANRAKFFVNSSVFHLFNILKDGLQHRIIGGDAFYWSINWNHSVSFLLFVLRCVHMQTDKKAYDLLVLAINDYLKGNCLSVDDEGMLIHADETSYLNYFDSPEGYSLINNGKSREGMIAETTMLYEHFIKIWNNHYNDNPHTFIEYAFALNFVGENYDENRPPNFSGSFNKLFYEYDLDGTNGIKLFNCRRKESEQPRFINKKISGFKIE